MVVVWPAGAQIPAKPPINPAQLSQLCQNSKTSSLSADLMREAVLSFVSRLDVYSACSTLLHTLNIESVLPAHLNQRPTPREIGIVKFSLDIGIMDHKFHAFIEPGPLPRGFMHEAQFHAETHRIPVLDPDFNEVTSDCESVYTDVLNFLESTDVVFSLSNLVHYTQEALDWIAENSGISRRRRLLVLPLESLTSELMLLSTGESGHSVRLRDELRPQILEHVTHIGCVYHATRDLPICALSTSHRQAVATHGFLQKYFWDHLTKLKISCNPSPQPVGANSVVDSLSKCDFADSDSSHSYRAASHHRSHISNQTIDKSANREHSNNQSLSRRRSCDSDSSSIFTLPDIFQNDEEDDAQSAVQADDSSDHDNGTPQPPRRPERFKNDPPLGDRTYSTNPNQNNQITQSRQTVRNTQVQIRTKRSPQVHNSPRPPGSADQPLRRVGLGRGFLKIASRVPPRKPNS